MGGRWEEEGSLLPSKGLEEVDFSQFSPPPPTLWYLNWGECTIQAVGLTERPPGAGTVLGSGDGAARTDADV